MNTKERLLSFLSYKDIGQNKFGETCGFSGSLINNSKGSIGSEIINKISIAYPELNMEWLITGKGEMLKEELNSEDYLNEESTSVKFKSVPLIPIDAIAGFPGEDIEGVRYEDCEQYNVPEFKMSRVEFVIRVSGSSMYPKYSNGDILACKKIDDILFFQWGKVYVIDSSQGSLVKRVFEDKENPDNLLLVSDNKENYPPFSIPKSDIRSLSIVLGVIRME